MALYFNFFLHIIIIIIMSSCTLTQRHAIA